MPAPRQALFVTCRGVGPIVGAVVVSVARSSDDDIAPPNQAVSAEVPSRLRLLDLSGDGPERTAQSLVLAQA